MTTFDSRSKTIGQLLGSAEERGIRVPQFQRSYSWEKSHVLTFSADILQFHREKAGDISQRYFFGPIVVLEKGKDLVLLDGQQRLATATILFATIRDKARKYNQAPGNDGNDLARDIQRDFIEKDAPGFSLELNQLDKEFYRRLIQTEDAGVPPPTASLRSHKLIEGARNILAESVEEALAAHRANPRDVLTYLKALKTTLANRVSLAEIMVGSDDDASMIFETLNDRGLRLSVPDLLLNHLMSKAQDDSQRQSIREAWNELTQEIGDGDIDRFLRHMWLSKYGDLKSQGLFREIKQYIHENRITSLEFAESCQLEADAYVALLKCDPQRIPVPAIPHVEHLLNHLGVLSSLPLLLAGLQKLNAEDFEKLTRSTLNLYVRHSLAANLNPGQIESAFYESARIIRVSAGTRDKVSGHHLHAAKERLKAIDPSDDKVVEGAKEMEVQGGTAHFILHAIAQALQNGGDEVELKKATIEHIFPRNPSADWTNVADLQPLVYNLGNLTLLGSRINKEVKNAGFEKKVHKYKESRIKMTNRIAEEHERWEKRDLLKRSGSLAGWFPKLWPKL